MCLGLPMQVISARPGRALAAGRGLQREVDTALVGDCAAGDWLLVFLDAARERIDATRAAEVGAALDLIDGVLVGRTADPAADPGFGLPSAMSAAQLAALTGAPPSSPTPAATPPMHTDALDTPATTPGTTPASTPDPSAADPGAGSAPLVQQLVSRHGARWVSRAGLDDFLALPGDQVLFFHGDPVRFPEVLDVAVVLPELRRALQGRFGIGVATRADEDAIAARFGANRWPSLLFLRDGQYVTLLPGMHDWTDYLARVTEALAMPTRRAPTVGIAVVSGAPAGGCH